MALPRLELQVGLPLAPYPIWRFGSKRCWRCPSAAILLIHQRLDTSPNRRGDGGTAVTGPIVDGVGAGLASPSLTSFGFDMQMK